MAPTLTRLPTRDSFSLLYVMSEQAYASQTAPIDEYRVLWTTVSECPSHHIHRCCCSADQVPFREQQKKQKLKKWHDGSLNYFHPRYAADLHE